MCGTMSPEPEAPSPKSQFQLTIVPSGSNDADPSSVAVSSADVTVGRADGAMLSLRVIGACGPLGVAGIVACAVADVVNVPASGPVVTSMCTLLDPPAGSSKGEVHRSVPSRVDGSFVVSLLVDPGV